jgi:hypothetical protein
MPKITTVTISLVDRDLGKLQDDLYLAANIPLDDLPQVSELADVIDLLRRHRTEDIYFRVPEFLNVTIAWKPVGTAAIVFILHRRRLRTAVLVLLGKDEQHDAMALSVIRASLDLTATEEAKLKSQPGPLLAFFDVSSLPLEVAHLIGVLMIVPALCELHGVE